MSLTCAFMLAGCGEKSEAQGASEKVQPAATPAKTAAATNTPAKTAAATNIPAIPQGPLAQVVAPYLNIGDMLASEKIDGIDAEVDKLDEALAKFADRPPLVGARAQLAALKGVELKAARAAFLPLSRAIIIAMSSDEASQAGMIKVLCPMAFASKGGRWIQREGKIRNPFEGSRMLGCGVPEPWNPPTASAAAR